MRPTCRRVLLVYFYIKNAVFVNMSSYFDEHDCDPLVNGEAPNHLLYLARFLLDSGLGVEWEMEYSRIFGGERSIPPASKNAIESLEVKNVSILISDQGMKCPICLQVFDEEDKVKILPCSHQFHDICIVTWLQQISSCPVCRFELPTDNPDYENYKLQKMRQKRHVEDVKVLHDSMFG